MSGRSWLPALLLLTGLTACGGSADDAGPPGAAPPPPASAPAEPTTEPTTDTVEAAREDYLRLLEPSGRAVQRLSGLLDDPASEVTAVQAAVDDYALATEEFAVALGARSWPAPVAAPIAELSRQLSAQTEPLRAAAQGADVAEIERLLGAVPPATAAQRVRDAF